jgi:hypothetical protein
MLPIQRLEQYSLRFPQEVLLVEADVAGQRDQIMVFKGFSSSLVQATASDPDVPILPADAVILSLSRCRAPYRPPAPEMIEPDLSWSEFLERLANLGL